MKFIFSTILVLFSSVAFGSNIVGTFIEHGKKLSIRIVDDPGLYPFEAGRLWSLIDSDQRTRSVVTDDMKISCEAVLKEGTNDAFGSCRIVVSVDKLKDNPQTLSYRLLGDEAISFNRLFVNDPFSLNLDLFRNSDWALNISVNRANSYFSLSIYKTIINADFRYP